MEKNNQQKKLLTLCLIHDDERVLLGMKKRGFGAGRWNGFGGKLMEGESIEEAARREVEEEAGVLVRNLEKRGIIEFEFDGNPEILEVHIFRSFSFDGDPQESDEMRPAWFAHEDIPFDEMWPDDRHWVPMFLEGRKFKGKFLFGKGDVLLDTFIEEVGDIV